jgi:hypothetical protein
MSETNLSFNFFGLSLNNENEGSNKSNTKAQKKSIGILRLENDIKEYHENKILRPDCITQIIETSIHNQSSATIINKHSNANLN